MELSILLNPSPISAYHRLFCSNNKLSEVNVIKRKSEGSTTG